MESRRTLGIALVLAFVAWMSACAMEQTEGTYSNAWKVCGDLLDKMEACLPEFQDVMCAGQVNCYVYIEDDAEQNCVNDYQRGLDEGEYTEEEMEADADEMVSLTCDEFVTHYMTWVETDTEGE